MKDAPTLAKQAELREHGLVTEPDGIYLSPCGTFALEPCKDTAKKRRRIYLRTPSKAAR